MPAASSLTMSRVIFSQLGQRALICQTSSSRRTTRMPERRKRVPQTLQATL